VTVLLKGTLCLAEDALAQATFDNAAMNGPWPPLPRWVTRPLCLTRRRQSRRGSPSAECASGVNTHFGG